MQQMIEMPGDAVAHSIFLNWKADHIIWLV